MWKKLWDNDGHGDEFFREFEALRGPPANTAPPFAYSTLFKRTRVLFPFYPRYGGLTPWIFHCESIVEL